MNIRKLLLLIFVFFYFSQLGAQSVKSDSIRFELKLNTKNNGFGKPLKSFTNVSMFTDSVTYIKSFDAVRMYNKMLELSYDTSACNCHNKYAVKVMTYRLKLIKKHFIDIQQSKWDDIESIMLNFYYITGYRHVSDGDFFGFKRISSYSIGQFESWLSQNKDRICIDMDSRLLYVPVNLSKIED